MEEEEILRIVVDVGGKIFEMRCLSCGQMLESLVPLCRCGGEKYTWMPEGCMMVTGEEDLAVIERAADLIMRWSTQAEMDGNMFGVMSNMLGLVSENVDKRAIKASDDEWEDGNPYYAADPVMAIAVLTCKEGALAIWKEEKP